MTNDKTKLVKEAKNDKASRCWFAYQKKIRENGIRRNVIRRNATQPIACSAVKAVSVSVVNTVG